MARRPGVRLGYSVQVRFLLDTHTLLWSLSDPELLSAESRVVLEESENSVYVSIASLWECAIKSSIGKLSIPNDFFAVATASFSLAPIEVPHIEAFRILPLHHRDPFDRILVSQALVDDLILMTRDTDIGSYNVKLLRS